MEKYLKAQDVCKAFADYIWSPLPRTVSYASSFVEKIPAADVAPVRHGRWVKMKGMMPPEYHGHYECSECCWHPRRMRSIEDREEEFTYCPNCGAKMDGGQDNA